MDPRDEPLDVGVVDDQPLEAEVVGRERDLAIRFVEVQQLLQVGIGGNRRVATTGFEAQSGLARRDEVELGLEGERRGGQGEEGVKFGLHLFGAPEERIT